MVLWPLSAHGFPGSSVSSSRTRISPDHRGDVFLCNVYSVLQPSSCYNHSLNKHVLGGCQDTFRQRCAAVFISLHVVLFSHLPVYYLSPAHPSLPPSLPLPLWSSPGRVAACDGHNETGVGREGDGGGASEECRCKQGEM